MAISKNKERIAVSLKKDQITEFDAVAKEIGITKSNLLQIATMQYITAYKQSKSVKSDVTSVRTQTLNRKEKEFEQLRIKNIL